jgi:signal transduction histidine kinase
MKGLDVLRTRIGRRYLMLFLLVSLLPLAAMGWFAAHSSETALREQTRLVLRSTADGVEAELREFLTHFKQQMLYLADEGGIRDSLRFSVPSANGLATALPDLSEVLDWQQQFVPDAQEIFVLSADGRVVASSEGQNVGTDAATAEYFRRGLQSFYPGDIFREPDSGRVTWIIAAPVRDTATRRLLGVVACRVDPRTLSDLTTGRRILAQGADTHSMRIGETGETYIVNRDRLMITESRQIPDAILKVRVDTLPVRTALEQGHEITTSYRDYRGREVNGASIILRELGWVVITEMDFTQAFAPVRQFRTGLIEVTIGLGLGVAFLAWITTRRITRPIQMLERSDRSLAGGDEATALVSENDLPDDEIGELVRARNARVRALLANQKQLEERTSKLHEALAELDQMSYSIMHDMRAPLRAITGFGELLVAEQGEQLKPESRNYLARMKTATLRMDHLICDVLDYSLVVRGELPLHPVNVVNLVRGIVETYPALQAVQTKIIVPPDLPTVLGNEAALTQCFSNLLDNAVKFAEPGREPQIQVGGERNNGRASLWVEDNGVGIPPALHERIFGMFHRGTALLEGTGIGLAIVRKAVERMGGRVGVISEPGKGSRFWLELQAGD